jgi:ATP synthase F1 gamma subunit
LSLIASSFFLCCFDQRSLMANVVVPEAEALKADTKKKVLVVAVTSDRGLCGGVNSVIARYSREQLKALKDAGHEVSMLTIGDKARAQIARDYPTLVRRAVDSCFDKDAIFPLVSRGVGFCCV